MELGEFGVESFANAYQALLEIGCRHPLRLEQGREIERRFSERGTIDRMIAEEALFRVSYNNIQYLLPGHFILGKKKQQDGGSHERN